MTYVFYNYTYPPNLRVLVFLYVLSCPHSYYIDQIYDIKMRIFSNVVKLTRYQIKPKIAPFEYFLVSSRARSKKYFLV